MGRKLLAWLGALCILLPTAAGAAAALSGGRWRVSSAAGLWIAGISLFGCLVVTTASLLLRRRRLLFVAGLLLVLQLLWLPVWLGQRIDTYGSTYGPLHLQLALLNGLSVLRLLVQLALGAGGIWLALGPRQHHSRSDTHVDNSSGNNG